VTTRTLALIGLLCLGAAGTTYTPPAQARTFVDLDINVAPPAPRYERVVVRPGYVWAPGYWQWDGRYRRHVWRSGYYVRARPGFVWVGPRWVQGPRGGWHRVEGYWARR